MVSAADETVANVTAAIEASGMANNTITLLLSDNGGPIQEPSGTFSPGNNWPLRGGKYGFYEGGIKVVGMIKYPARISHGNGRAGTVWGGLVHTSDWYATLCNAGGVSPVDTGPGRVPIDGIDVLYGARFSEEIFTRRCHWGSHRYST
jgi:arylsulfatase A-like enzyme